MPWWGWLLLAFGFLLAELMAAGGFYFIFFGISALLIAGLNGIFGLPAFVQWLLFSVISVAALLFFRRPLLRKFKLNGAHKQVDSLVGQTAVALEEIAAGGFGKAELRGTAWAAKNVGTATLVLQQRCIVEQVDGLMLLVRSD